MHLEPPNPRQRRVEDSPRGRRTAAAGMTLIEVLVALVILGTLLATATLARGRYLRQAVVAQRKLRAVEAADALLAQWSNRWSTSDGEIISRPAGSTATQQPLRSSGIVPGKDRLAWRTTISDPEDARQLRARVLRLEILDAELSLQPSTASGSDDLAAPLASVEVLIPLAEPKQSSVGTGE